MFWENAMLEHSLEANPDIRNGIILHRKSWIQTAGKEEKKKEKIEAAVL